MDKDLVLIKAIIDADYKRHIKRFEQLNASYDHLLLGDSMMAYMPLKKMGYDNICNQGIPGDTTCGVLDRLKFVFQVKPKNVFLHIGSNDLVLTSHDDHQIISNIQAIIAELNTKEMHVIVLSITPVLENHPKTNQTFIKNRTNIKIDRLNEQIKKLKGIKHFIDVNPQLKDKNDQLNENYTTDGVHLNQSGYDILMNLIKPWMKE